MGNPRCGWLEVGDFYNHDSWHHDELCSLFSHSHWHGRHRCPHSLSAFSDPGLQSLELGRTSALSVCWQKHQLLAAGEETNCPGNSLEVPKRSYYSDLLWHTHRCMCCMPWVRLVTWSAESVCRILCCASGRPFAGANALVACRGHLTGIGNQPRV